MENITLKHHMVTFDEFMKHSLYKGWEDEPVTGALKVPGDAIGIAFPNPDSSMCITAYDGDKIIGQSNANNYDYYTKNAPSHFQQLCEYNHEGTQKWGQMWKEIHDLEALYVHSCLKRKYFKLKQESLELKDVAHRAGLMVMPNYTYLKHPNLKLSDRLIEASDQLLKSQGYKAVVVTASNSSSRKVFIRMGYKLVKKFEVDLKPNCGIDEKYKTGDKFTALIKIF